MCSHTAETSAALSSPIQIPIRPRRIRTTTSSEDQTRPGQHGFPAVTVQKNSVDFAVARGSHRRGKLETFEGVGPGGRQVPVEEDSVWVGGDYMCGDVIILHSLTIHQGRDNESADRLRISSDYRYQPRSHPVRDDSLQPHNELADLGRCL